MNICILTLSFLLILVSVQVHHNFWVFDLNSFLSVKCENVFVKSSWTLQLSSQKHLLAKLTVTESFYKLEMWVL